MHPLGPSRTIGDSGTRQRSTSPDAIVAANEASQDTIHDEENKENIMFGQKTAESCHVW